MEFSREVMGFLQVVIDIISALTVLYVAVVITAQYGFHNTKERLQFAHRVCLVLVSVAFAYHAEDIMMNFSRHGLTATNVLLHLSLMSCIVISTIRMTRQATKGAHVPYKNGGSITGPLRSH